MRRDTKLPELLAPAGDFECLISAVKAGADAIYVGGESFGARAYAKNFTEEELYRATVYCHLHGVRLYVTENVLLSDGELESAVDFAQRLCNMGVDALIVADMGLIRSLRRELPQMELHGSTQISAHNSYGADIAYEAGCSRVVLARECSAGDIAQIVGKCKPKIEVFLHGALCVSHSGQCLFSSLVGGRSGNRGECAQPCRLPYNGGKYPLSLKDLSLADHVPSLIDSGVESLKIEGRMKDPSYVYTVTSIYRRLLDEGRAASPSEAEELRRAFSRQGFTDGYYTGRIGGPMTGVRSREDKDASRESQITDLTPDTVAIKASCRIVKDEPATLTLTLPDGSSVTAEGDIPQPARSAPLTPSDVCARLAKMGGTLYNLSAEDVELELDEGLNLSPASLNGLRRRCVEELDSALAHRVSRTALPLSDITADEDNSIDPIGRVAVFHRPEALCELSAELLQSFDAVAVPLHRLSEAGGLANCVALPPVIMESELDGVKRMLDEAVSLGIKHALLTNVGQIGLIRDYPLTPIGDLRLNVTNRQSYLAYRQLGLRRLILSAELDGPSARRIGGAVAVCGRIPLMLTERCFMKESFGCKSCSSCALTDRRGAKFPMLREYPHRNLILNSHHTYMGDRRGELRGLGEYFIFTTEEPKQIRAILRAYDKGEPFPLDTPFRRLGRR